MHGLVWLDTNADGIRTGNEAVYSGSATVKLLQSGQTIATATTNASGVYTFANVVPGTYAVQVVAPSGYSLSPQDRGSDDAADSDVDPGTGQSGPFSVVSGQDYTGPDAGLYQGVVLLGANF